MKHLLFSLAMGTSLYCSAQCDPWIQKAYQQVLGRSASAAECNIKNYNNGSWGSYAELAGYVARYNGKGDPWLFQAYVELYNKVPSGSELNIRNYNNGSWNSYAELRKYIQTYQNSLTQASYKPSTDAQAQAEKQSTIYASYMMAFGRLPQKSEVSYWMGQNSQSFRSFLENHRNFAYNQDEGTRKSLITRSYIDILGRKPSEQELNYWIAQRKLYMELTINHVKYLTDNPAEYNKVISSSYQSAFGRPATEDEIKYWKSQGVLSYVVLLSCHEDWKRRNQQPAGKSSLSGSSGTFATVGVSDAVANDIKNMSAAGAVASGGGNVISPGGGNVIAPGGANVVAPGGANAVAAGGANVIGIGAAGVVAAGGMN